MAGHSLFPSILPGEDFVDDSYTKGELTRMSRQELQSLAAEHESDEVDGRMSNEDIIAFMEGEERL